MTVRISLEGRRILAVEDEMLAAMMLEDILRHAGCDVIVIGHLDEATLLAREQEIDAAVLDVNLHGLRSYPVADALGLRGIPFVFATGYGNADLHELYPRSQVVSKPYKDTALLAALAAVISAASKT